MESKYPLEGGRIFHEGLCGISNVGVDTGQSSAGTCSALSPGGDVLVPPRVLNSGMQPYHPLWSMTEQLGNYIVVDHSQGVLNTKIYI